MSVHIPNTRPEFDQVILDIVDYVLNYKVNSVLAYETARYCLLDTLGCGLQALEFPACTKLLGPLAPGMTMQNGARVPGTSFELDPVQAAFNIGTMIRWLDFNDTWLAAEWGHPSDNLGGILAVADWLARNGKQLTIRDVLTAMIKAHEIQGCLALENSFNKVGLDHVMLVKVASTAVVAGLLGLTREQMLNAVSLAWVDGQALRTYRHAPNTGSRKSWAAGDATARAVRLALIAQTGEMGYPSALSAPVWGFYDVSFRGQPFRFQREYGSYVMENVLFKISFPAEFHAQTAVEAAMTLHAQLAALGKTAADIERVTIRTHEACLRIIDKQGPLNNPADRDHCIQYMVAVPLIFGRLTAEDYEDALAFDTVWGPRIDAVRARTFLAEDPQFTADYHDTEKRSIANALRLELKDGTFLPEMVVEYPIGHRLRRVKGIPLLLAKFTRNLERRLPDAAQHQILSVASDQTRLEAMPVDEFVSLFTIQGACLTLEGARYAAKMRLTTQDQPPDYTAMLQVAIAEARQGLAEGGIPIGAAIFRADGTLVSSGRNRRVQQDDPSIHGETDAFRRAGRQRSYRDLIMVTTLAPCWYCTGLVRQFGFGTVVVGESETFQGGTNSLRELGVRVVDLDSAECKEMLRGFIAQHPEIWNEDIGVDE